MKRRSAITHKFVEFIPSELDEGTLYISTEYATAAHKCCCGCGNRVVTPLSPTDWSLIFDGRSVSLNPSIGNWSFPCRSHYWIKNNQVKWAPIWSRKEIERGRAYDRQTKEAFETSESLYEKRGTSTDRSTSTWNAVRERFRRWFSE